MAGRTDELPIYERRDDPNDGGADEQRTAAAAAAFARSRVLRAIGRVAAFGPRLPRRLVGPVLKLLRAERPPVSVRWAMPHARASAGGVRCVWLNRDRRDRGVLVYLHGGAYIVGPAASEWHWLATIARRTGVAAIVVLYRMPPRDPFPAAFDDAAAAVAALLERGELRPDRWILAGGSAGGGLALSALRLLLDRGASPPAGLLAVAPWVDLELAGPGVPDADALDPILGRGWLRWAAGLYAGAVPLEDPRLSPLGASFAGFPPTRVDVGTRDLFLPDNRRLRDRLVADGVRVDYREQPGGVHTYPQFVFRPEARAALDVQARWVRERLGERAF